MFADRWKLIDSDTLPDFLAFIQRHPDEARALVSIPVSSRAARYRLMRMGRLATGALARWNVDIATAPATRPRLAIRSTERPALPDDGDTRIDLTSPPLRDSANIAAETDSRVWMNANQQPFDLAVALPGGRVYRARAQKAVLISSTRGAAPDRLAVQLPSTGLDVTEQTIAEYANDWRFPASAVDRWRAAAEHHASSDHEYSTQVFTAEDVGFVHLEVQVSHHVHDRDFVVVTLFSWDNHVSAPSDASSPIAPANQKKKKKKKRHHEVPTCPTRRQSVHPRNQRLQRSDPDRQQVTWRTACTSRASSFEIRRQASSVGMASRSTPRRAASAMTSGAIGNEPWAPVPMISRRPPHGSSSAADNGVCPNSVRYGFEGPFFRLRTFPPSMTTSYSKSSPSTLMDPNRVSHTFIAVASRTPTACNPALRALLNAFRVYL